MIVEYEGEQDADPLQVVLRQWDQDREVWGPRRRIGHLLPPAPGEPVHVNYEPYRVQSLRFNSYVGNPEMDWVEVFLS